MKSRGFFRPLSDGKFILLPLLVAVAGAALFHSRCYVGFYNDDASFVLLAGRLWDATRTLSFSGLAGAFSHFLPGYPLFLAPFAAALEPHWGLLRWTTAAVSLLNLYGLWLLLDGWLSAVERRWVVLLYAAHPLFLMSSGLVMADPFLSCLCVYGLLGLRWVLERKGGAWAYVLLLTMSAWAAAAKPIGIVLPLALTAGLIAAKNWRGLRLTAALVWLPLTGACLYAVIKRGTPTDYISTMLRGLGAIAHDGLWARAYNLFYSFVLQYGLACPWPRGPFFDAVGALIIAGVLHFCAKGLAALLSGPAPKCYLALSAGLLLLTQGLVMSLWTVYSERYALPMLPFGLLFLVSGAHSFNKARPVVIRAALASLAIGFLGYSAWLAAIINSERRPVESRLCSGTLDWIARKTPADSRFSCTSTIVQLYTGRRAFGLSSAPNADLFFAYLYRQRITYAFVTTLPVLSARGPYIINDALQQATERDWIRSHPGIFRKLYSNPDEKTEIYGVNVPAGWGKAAVLYEQALRDLKIPDWPAATGKLRQALSSAPDFPSALVTLAAVRFLNGRDAAEAERLLRRVLELEPNYPKASRLLVMVLESRGRPREAEAARAASKAALSHPAFEAAP